MILLLIFHVQTCTCVLMKLQFYCKKSAQNPWLCKLWQQFYIVFYIQQDIFDENDIETYDENEKCWPFKIIYNYKWNKLYCKNCMKIYKTEYM